MTRKAIYGVWVTLCAATLLALAGCTKNASEPGARPAPPAAESESAGRSPQAPADVRQTPAGQAAPVQASVRGTVIFRGKLPEPIPIDMTADPLCAKINAKGVVLRTAAADAEGGLADAFVYVKKGLEGRQFQAPSEPKVLDQHLCQFEPRVFGIQVGQPLEIRNEDATLHNVHSLPTKSRGFNLGMPMQGMKTLRRFTRPEVLVRIKCDVHPWMSSYAGVVEHPFYDVSDAHGRFSIEGLAPGQYTIEAVHPKLGSIARDLRVTAAGVADLSLEIED